MAERGLINVKQYWVQNKKSILIFSILFVLFFSLYFSLGLLLSKTKAFNENDTLFQSDCPLVIRTISRPLVAHRTDIHPLYKFIMYPSACLLRNVIHSEVVAALISSSFCGALGVALAYVFFWLFSKNYLNATLLSLIFGLSMSKLFFSIVPDFPSLIMCSLLIMYILFLLSLSKRRLFFIAWILAGIFSFGVAIVNITQALIFFIVLLVILSREKRITFSCPLEIAGLIISIFFLTAFLANIQNLLTLHHRIRLSSVLALFFDSFHRYAGLLVFHKPLLVITTLVKHFFMVNFVAPIPDSFVMSHHSFPGVTFTTSWKYSIIGWIGLLFWLIVLIGGIVRSLFPRQKFHPLFFCASLCPILYMIFHSFYGVVQGVPERGGIEYFEYTGNFTFLVFMFLSPYSLSRKPLVRLSLLSLAVLFGYNNLMVVKYLLDFYQ